MLGALVGLAVGVLSGWEQKPAIRLLGPDGLAGRLGWSWLFSWCPKSLFCSLFSLKNLNQIFSVWLVSQWTRWKNRSKLDAFVELFVLYNPVENCSGDLARSPENRGFLTCRAPGSKWILIKSFRSSLVLAKGIYQDTEEHQSNKLDSESHGDFFCWSPQKWQNTLLEGEDQQALKPCLTAFMCQRPGERQGATGP